MDRKRNSVVLEPIQKLFRPALLCWNFLGQIAPSNISDRLKKVLSFYGVILSCVATVGYPLHLTIGLFVGEKSLAETFQNLAINIAVTVCSIKSLWIWWKLAEVQEVMQLMERLQGRLQSAEEKLYYKLVVLPRARKIQHLFYFVCFGTAITSELAVIIAGILAEWRLMYPAYFPFNPYATTWSFFVAHAFQTLGNAVLTAENFINDTVMPMCIIILSGHVKLLGLRASKIGFDPGSTKAENDLALLECHKDHKDLLMLRRKLQSIMSFYMFFQIFGTGSCICISIIYMIFWVNDVFTFAYYVIYVFAVALEPFPPCYYGTVMEWEFNKLTKALCSGNWIEQSSEFKRHLQIFTQQTMKPITIRVLGMFPINLHTYFATCRMAYSLFAVLMQMK